MTIATISQNTGATYAGVSHSSLFEQFAGSAQTNTYAGVVLAQSATADRRHSTLTFSGLSNIPAGATITSASLALTAGGGSGGVESMSIYKLLVPHAGRLIETWNDRDTGVPWTSNGGNNATDIDTTPAATTTVTAANGQIATFSGAGLAALVQGWVSGAIANHGVMLAQTTEASLTGTSVYFWSPDNATLGPVLTVDYTVVTGPTVTSASSNSNTEGSAIVHTITLSAATTASTNFAATLGGVSATGGGTDFTSALASLTYSAGVTVSGSNLVVPSGVSSFTVSIPTTGDVLNEANETYTLTVGGVSGTGTITDNDAVPSVAVGDATQVGGTVTHTITLSAASGRTVTVDYATTNGTKVAGVDYTASTGTLTFAPGETSKTVAVTVL